MRSRRGPPRSVFARIVRVAILVVLVLWALLVLVSVLTDEDPAPLGAFAIVLVPVTFVLTVMLAVGWLRLPRSVVRVGRAVAPFAVPGVFACLVAAAALVNVLDRDWTRLVLDLALIGLVVGWIRWDRNRRGPGRGQMQDS